MSNNHNFNHFTGKKKARKQAKRKKHSKVQKGHKNKYERFCKAPKNNQSNLYWDTFSKEEKAQIANELYPFIAERLANDLETACANSDVDSESAKSTPEKQGGYANCFWDTWDENGNKPYNEQSSSSKSDKASDNA